MMEVLLRFVFALLLAVSALPADVVELNTGERLEGIFRSVTSEEIQIYAVGQVITMPLEKVRMIHFALRTSAPRKALMAVKALQSVTMIGTNYRDYAYRVSYAKMTVDPFLRSLDQKDVTSRSAIALAMRYHELAAQAWKANVLFETDSRQSADTAATVEHTLEENTEIGSCTGLKRWIASAKARFDQRPKPTRAYEMPAIRGYKMPSLRPEDRFFLMGKNLGAEPEVLWQCASERISEAERLVGKQQGESLRWVEWGFGQPHPLLRRQ